MEKDLRKNETVLTDTADKQTKDDVRFYKLLHTIFHVCEIAGFELQGRITLKDKKTGKVWK